MNPIDKILERLVNVKETSNGFDAFCPAHGDERNPHLGISEGADGRVLLKCRKGCLAEEIVAALGLEMKDLFPENPSRRQIDYEVHDVEGNLVAIHRRLDTDGEKKVWWVRPDGKKGLNGHPLSEMPLYGSEMISKWDESVTITICEGEKATKALLENGIPALGTVTGAGGTPGEEVLKVLKGRRVCLWPDNDKVGREHMEHVAAALDGVAQEVRIFEWKDAPANGDAADHPAIKNGDPGVAKQLLKDLKSAPRWKPPTEIDPPIPVGRLLSTVQAEPVEWLWPGRIPLGKITLIDGDPGTGKSAMTMDLAARVSVGRAMPDGAPCEDGGVVLLNAEDGCADTIRPRLEAAGGNADLVLDLATVPDGDNERLLSIPKDLDIIRRGIERVGAKLVIVDPLMAFLSGDVNSHHDQDVRRALAPLAKLAEETGAAVVVVRHLNKAAGGSPLYRGGGSIGIIGQARSALLVAKHPEDERRRVLASLKLNLAKPASSLAFVITEAPNGAAYVEWKGTTPLDAGALLAAPGDDQERRDQLALRDAVVRFLEKGGGGWEGTASELYELLAESDLAELPERPDELTKSLLKMNPDRSGFTVRKGYRGNNRILRLHLHHVADSEVA